MSMVDSAEAVSLLIALEFVVLSAIVLFFVPLEAAAPILPLLLVFVAALQVYWVRK